MKTAASGSEVKGDRSSSSSSSSSDSEGSKSDKSTPPQSPRPRAAHPSSRISRSPKKVDVCDTSRPIPPQSAGDSELHILRHRKVRSAPTRPHSMMSQSANMIYLQKELERIHRQMEHARRTNMAKKPRIQPYTPYTWNSLSPYYNTDSVDYLLKMPVPVRQGYSTRMTAIGMVDPEVSWRMDHVLAPINPSRPEVYRRHLPNRRAKSAAAANYSNEMISPQYPKLSVPREEHSETSSNTSPRYSAKSAKQPAVPQTRPASNPYHASPRRSTRTEQRIK